MQYDVIAIGGGFAGLIAANRCALRADGSLIEGLFAAGSTVAGIEGGPNAAYMGGLSKAYIFGLLAAEAIAARAGKAASTS
jgi:fumarate reductase flavoprotein subunit